jgi:hypothetical protein
MRRHATTVAAVWSSWNDAEEQVVPGLRIFKYSKTAQKCKVKTDIFYCSKNTQVFLRLDLNMLRNFLNWVDFKFPTEIML